MAQIQVIAKPKTVPERKTRTVVDTILLTQKSIDLWKLPGGQRPLRENSKVLALSERLKSDGGIIPGVLTLGVLGNDWYLIDGQHRVHAFRLSGMAEGYADVRFLHVTSMSEINREFVELNSQLVRLTPDDLLRGMEDSIPALKAIRGANHLIVGYGMIRRNTANSSGQNPVVSMSALLRAWRCSSMDAPAGNTGGLAIMDIAESMTEQETHLLVDFLKLAATAFGREKEYWRLWSAINLTMCMWLYRRLVVTQYSPKSPRLDNQLFQKCLMSLSADSQYLDWLLGRMNAERDRAPCYSRIKSLFASRLEKELGRKVHLPAPEWSK